jgi:hypothetical protein
LPCVLGVKCDMGQEGMEGGFARADGGGKCSVFASF